MPVVCHGRSPKQSGGPTGSYVFRTWTKSGWSTYTLTNAKKQTATVSICVKCRNYRGQWKRHGRQPLIYASWGYRPASPESVFTTYRLRFGIETSYRQMHGGQIRTTTRNPVVRLLSVGIALVLRNLWVWLHDTLSPPEEMCHMSLQRSGSTEKFWNETVYSRTDDRAKSPRGQRVAGRLALKVCTRYIVY